MAEPTAFPDLLRQGAVRLGLGLPEEALARLCAHREILLRWAPRVNLTTVLDPVGMAERLYLDSAILAPWLPVGARLHDVGSGAGFPGLVLKAVRPDLDVSLTEARRKRVSFLGAAAREMGLDRGLQILWERVGWTEATQPRLSGEVVSRATFPPAEWLGLGPKLVEPGGRLWLMAGQPHPPVDGVEEGPEEWLAARMPEGFSLERIERYALPFCGLRRWLAALRRG